MCQLVLHSDTIVLDPLFSFTNPISSCWPPQEANFQPPCISIGIFIPLTFGYSFLTILSSCRLNEPFPALFPSLKCKLLSVKLALIPVQTSNYSVYACVYDPLPRMFPNARPTLSLPTGHLLVFTIKLHLPSKSLKNKRIPFKNF